MRQERQLTNHGDVTGFESAMQFILLRGLDDALFRDADIVGGGVWGDGDPVVLVVVTHLRTLAQMAEVEGEDERRERQKGAKKQGEGRVQIRERRLPAEAQLAGRAAALWLVRTLALVHC
jgi:hypothetical protein